MSICLKFLSVFIIGETIAYPAFWLVRKKLSDSIETDGKNEKVETENEKASARNKAIILGVLERLVLFFGMTIGITQVVIMFGALKIGTKFNRSNNGINDKKFNDYFLIGNLTSVLFALLYFFLHHLWSGLPLP